jgi:hypothetical protein
MAALEINVEMNLIFAGQKYGKNRSMKKNKKARKKFPALHVFTTE